jgi:hypothetical protein
MTEFAWFTRFKRRKHEETLLATLEEAQKFKELVGKQPCMACGQNGLKLDKFERNVKGWEAEVSCGHENCNFHGFINIEGFTFDRMSSKGKARD